MKKRNYLILLLSALLIGFIGCQPVNGQIHYVEKGKIITEYRGDRTFDMGSSSDPYVGCDDGYINRIPYVLTWTSKGKAYVIRCNDQGAMQSKTQEYYGAKITDMRFTGDSKALIVKNGKRYNVTFSSSGSIKSTSQKY